MERLEGAVRLDFYGAEGLAARAEGAVSSRTLKLDRKQRAAPPIPHAGVVMSIVPGAARVAPLAGATLTAGPFLPRRMWTGAANEQRFTHALLAFTNAKPGREFDFDEWYWNQHFPDGLRLPGCYAGRRYELAEGGAGPYRHLAIYQYAIADIGETIAAVAQRSGTPEMPLTDAISPTFEAWWVTPEGGWRSGA